MSLVTAARFGSVRQKSRSTVRRPSFRDDMNLVAIRYEKTSRGEVPIHVETVNPIRAPSRCTSRPTSSASSTISRSHSRRDGSPIVVCPPPGSVPPPTEEHPALRKGPVLPRTATLDEWKRDSGHGAASSSSATPTINEEDCEDDECLSDMVRSKNIDAVIEQDQTTLYRADSIQPDNPADADKHDSVCTAETSNQLRPASYATAVLYTREEATEDSIAEPASVISVVPQAHPESENVAISSSAMASGTDLASTSYQKRLVKSFSLRSMSSLLGGGAGSGSVGSAGSAGGGVSQAGPGSISGAVGLQPPQPVGPLQPLQRRAIPPEAATVPDLGASDGTWTDATTAMTTTTDATNTTNNGPESHHLHRLVPKSHQHQDSHSHSRPQPPVPGPFKTRKTLISTTSSFWKRLPFSPMSQSQRRDTLEDTTLIPPLSVSLPSDGLLDDDFLETLSFSKRGSLMFGGHRALGLDGAVMDAQKSPSSPQPPSESQLQPPLSNKQPAPSLDSGATLSPTATPASESAPRSGESVATNETPDTGFATPDAAPRAQLPAPEAEPSQPQQQLAAQNAALEPEPRPSTQGLTPDIRVMEADVDKESQKVRSLYSTGDAIRWEDGARPSLGERAQSIIEEVSAEEDEQDPPPARLAPSESTPKSADSSSLRPSSSHKRDNEVAGGMEDYDDLDGAVVDRYGFITAPPRPGSSRSRLTTPTELKSSQFSPRRRNVLQKRDAVGVSSPLGRRPPSRKVSARSLNTQHSGMSATSFRSQRSVLRQASNLLPHNRDRRWMDEAGDMLTVSPSLQDIAEEARVEKISEALKRKEWERSEKWRKMAKVRKGARGEGMEFDFDAKNPKVIERTWKGVPDCWRTAAWWSFLETAAKNHPGSPTSEQIIADFHRLQESSSPDDVQIDLDVPRTINRHIMFRRRYRGGQRLLFRVLHALSIYFPETGYVQGMAALGATLLCYFEEEKCFVMLVRMWELRGLDRLYRPGFEGLMTGLQEFETGWLNKDVANKLTELCIDATAYGTRWYLTLFNMSIPFPAQLRIWDVFLLLGSSPAEAAANKPQVKKPTISSPTPTGLDVLHAASAALIQALREVLLDSDFENAMRAITAFVPIKDEDLLMKVTKAEWKAHQSKKKV